MEEIKYIRADLNDVQILVDYRIAFSDELAGKQSTEKENELRQSLSKYFSEKISSEYLSWYATVNGEVAAIAGMGLRTLPGNTRNPSGKWAYIMSVYTVPEHRRKGLCAQLLKNLIADGKERGVTAFELHATKDGEAVYVKEGFVIHHEPTYRKFL